MRFIVDFSDAIHRARAGMPHRGLGTHSPSRKLTALFDSEGIDVIEGSVPGQSSVAVLACCSPVPASTNASACERIYDYVFS